MSILTITSENFESEVINSDVPVLVDFWASWCMPCKMMAPVLEEIANEVGSSVKVAKINVDDNADLATRYGIMSIPTFLVFRNGEVSNMTVGMQDKADILNLLK